MTVKKATAPGVFMAEDHILDPQQLELRKRLEKKTTKNWSPEVAITKKLVAPLLGTALFMVFAICLVQPIKHYQLEGPMPSEDKLLLMVAACLGLGTAMKLMADARYFALSPANVVASFLRKNAGLTREDIYLDYATKEVPGTELKEHFQAMKINFRDLSPESQEKALPTYKLAVKSYRALAEAPDDQELRAAFYSYSEPVSEMLTIEKADAEELAAEAAAEALAIQAGKTALAKAEILSPEAQDEAALARTYSEALKKLS